MRISSILPVISNKLYRVEYDDNGVNILRSLQDHWTNTEWLFNFFTTFNEDLKKIPQPIKIKEAAKLAKQDADDLFLTLFKNNGTNLTNLFIPLINGEEIQNNQSQKGRLSKRNSWLRIYAVHYDGRFIVTGGAIKLTRTMNERPHLKEELYKLELLRTKLGLDIKEGNLGYLDL